MLYADLAMLYADKVIPASWLPDSLAKIKAWTWREIATDYNTPWQGGTGNQHQNARQWLHISTSIRQSHFAALAPEEKVDILRRQELAFAMLYLFPSRSKCTTPQPENQTMAVPAVV